MCIRTRAGYAGKGGQQRSDKREKTAYQYCRQAGFIEKVMGAWMITAGEMREPGLHGAGIPQAAALNRAHPATQAGRGGKQQNG
ncbi:hypothetical protein SE10_22570, partial [Salmonella enterica subsp. enterica serovar Mbandaka]